MKIPFISGLEVIKRLKKAGFIATRQRGSHVRLEKWNGDKTLKITVPMHDELRRGTLAHTRRPESSLL
ncbi:type II toxin-antitoxin system HicA family toxin [Candidatus Woesearchaeota archaeon]|nr:type II toxin-antitoxin system HicA family toxin [Candidatus Woesearchaeota archaeon]